MQPIEDGKVKTQIFDIEEGRTSIIESEMTLPNIQDPQKLGSAITYFRRYTLQSLLGLQAEDDDGSAAAKHVNKPLKPLTDKDLELLESKVKECKDRNALTVIYNSDPRYKTSKEVSEIFKVKGNEFNNK